MYMYRYIQLFRQRLSHESVKAYATMPIRMMGRKSLALIDWGSVFTNKKREGIDSFICAVSLSISERPKASIKDHKPQLPIIPFGIVEYCVLVDNLSRNSCRHIVLNTRALHSSSNCCLGFKFLESRTWQLPQNTSTKVSYHKNIQKKINTLNQVGKIILCCPVPVPYWNPWVVGELISNLEKGWKKIQPVLFTKLLHTFTCMYMYNHNYVIYSPLTLFVTKWTPCFSFGPLLLVDLSC